MALGVELWPDNSVADSSAHVYQLAVNCRERRHNNDKADCDDNDDDAVHAARDATYRQPGEAAGYRQVHQRRDVESKDDGPRLG